MYLLNKQTPETSGREINRRQLIRMGIITAASVLVPNAVLAAIDESPPQSRELSFINVYTREKIELVYWQDGRYIPESLAQINYLFRDHRTGKMREIDTGLLDLLYSIQEKLNCKKAYRVMSGYRTPRSNAILRKKRKGVAKNSFHMYGKAVDIRLPGYSLKTVRQAAMSFRQGGVGYYPRSRFIHVDVGPVRYWWG